MKTLNTIFLSIAASLLMSACTSSDHMTFWGGPIDGPKQEFVQKDAEKNRCRSSGQHWKSNTDRPFKHDHQDSYFLVVESKPDVDVVNKVALLYPSLHGWTSTRPNTMK